MSHIVYYDTGPATSAYLVDDSGKAVLHAYCPISALPREERQARLLRYIEAVAQDPHARVEGVISLQCSSG